MADYEKNTVVQTVPTEPEDEPGRNWLRIIPVLAAAIIVSLLLILIARWIYGAVTDDSPSTETSIQTRDENQVPAGPGGEPYSPKPQSLPSTQSTPTNTQLPNSGPEHIAAIFTGSSLAGAGMHYLFSRRRSA